MGALAIQHTRVALTLLGPFRLSANGEDVALRGRKACALLAYLALAQNHRALRELVADLLWTDRGTEQARASLRQTLAELRAVPALADAVAIDRAEIALLVDSVASDIGDILAACENEDLPALAELASRIEGDLLDSFGDVSPRFDGWLAVERPARRDQIVAQALACLERAGMTAPEQAQTVLRALDRLDPHNEAVARLGMRLDHATGDSAALHRRYRRLADQLQSEYGVAPSETTRALFQELSRERDTAPASADTHSARPAPSPRNLTDELMPAVVVAPLQLIGDTGLSPELADFCVDDMRMAIGALNGIKVLAADTSDIAAILAESADSLALYLLSGKVRDPGTGPVAMMQLANARDRSILWSESIALRETADPVEALVAKAVGALQPAIDLDLERMLRQTPLHAADERVLFVHARIAIRRATELADTLRGVEALEAIVARNPRHLGAHLLLGRMYNTDFWAQMTGHDFAAFRERAAAHLDTAAGLAPNRVDVRVRRAWVFLRKGAYDAAAKEFDAVVNGRQLDPDIVNQCACGIYLLGDLTRAEALMQQAFELNPFAPSDYHADYAAIKALAGQAEEAEDHFLVSGESGLFYDAIRIANFAGLAAGSPSSAEVEARFARKFIAAWQASGTPRVSDVVDWTQSIMPFRERHHRDWLAHGLEQRLPSFWPAG